MRHSVARALVRDELVRELGKRVGGGLMANRLGRRCG